MQALTKSKKIKLRHNCLRKFKSVIFIADTKQTVCSIFAFAKRFTRARESTALDTRRKNMRFIELYVHNMDIGWLHGRIWKGMDRMHGRYGHIICVQVDLSPADQQKQ